jgi:hypothetical protein
VLVLTAGEFKQTPREDLGETWEILKSRPDAVWISGSAADVVRRETLSVYI